MTMRVLSFDFDGCIFNGDYVNSCKRKAAKEINDIIKYNESFLKEIRAENDRLAYTNVISFIGSNRQSKAIDDLNSIKFTIGLGIIKVGSCFPAIQAITNYLSVKFDSFLLADIYGHYENGNPLEDGTSYNRAIDPAFKGMHADWEFDETKATIIYAQMHKIALANPKEEIVFDFYDDRNDILYSLHNFFNNNKELMPRNVTLHLNQYVNSTLSHPFADIVGSGIIDANYRATVIEMAQKAKDTQAFSYSQSLKVSEQLNPKLLTNRCEIPFTKAENNFFSILNQIFDKAIKLRKDGHINASASANELIRKISTHFNDYKSKTINYKSFQDLCAKDLSDAHKVLDMHRGLKKLLVNLAIATLTFGLGHLVLSIANGHFTLFNPKTKSQEQLDKLKSALTEINIIGPRPNGVA